MGMQFADFAWKGKGAKADGSGKEWLSTSGKVKLITSERRNAPETTTVGGVGSSAA